jgi:hypothetical protein
MGKKAEQAVNWVGEKGNQAISFVGETVEAIAEDPLPFIATIALTAVGVPPPLASAAVTAARGGSMEDIVISAAATYAGGEVGKAAGAGATSAGASATTAKIAASAAGASTATVTASLASGKSFDESLKAGLTAGALAGGTTGVIEYGKEALAPPETGQGIKAVPGKSSQLSKDAGFGEPGITEPSLLGDQTKVSGTGFTDKVPTGGGQGLVVDPATVLYTSQFTPSTGSRVRGTEEGGLQPAYTSAADSSGIAPSTPYQEPRTVTEVPEPPISRTTEQLARPVVSGALSELFGLGPKVPGAPSAGDSSGVAQTATTGTTVGLTGAGGAGEIESKESGKKRSSVWNEESLRLKDALGV